MTNTNEENPSTKLSDFLVKHSKVILGLIAVLFVLVVAAAASSAIMAKSTSAGIAQVDAIDYTFRKDVDSVSAEDFAARQDAALAEVESFCSKSGIVGVRANMLKAEILFQKKDYENSRDAWVKAVKGKSSAYTAPIANYNAAVCSENLNDLDSAVSFYGKAVEAKEFYLVDHAYFSLGRVNETKGDISAAKDAYNKLIDLHSTSKWADVAKSRLIAIGASETKAE